MMVSRAYSVGCLVHSPFRFSQDLQSKNGIVSATLSRLTSKGPEGAGGTPLSIMYFSEREKRAIMAVVCAMGGADDKVDPREAILIKLVSDKVGIDVQKHTPLTDLEEALNVISAMTAEEKRFVCAYLGRLITIDRDIDPREVVLWNVFSSRCNFPSMSLADAERYIGNLMN